jgi:hypothetical protein
MVPKSDAAHMKRKMQKTCREEEEAEAREEEDAEDLERKKR